MGMNGDVFQIFEILRIANDAVSGFQQVVHPADFSFQIVGHSAGGIGNIGAAIKNGNIIIRTKPFDARRGFRAAGGCSNDDDPFRLHRFSLSKCTLVKIR